MTREGMQRQRSIASMGQTIPGLGKRGCIGRGYPQEKFTVQRVGVVWSEFVTTSIILVATSKKKLC